MYYSKDNATDITPFVSPSRDSPDPSGHIVSEFVQPLQVQLFRLLRHDRTKRKHSGPINRRVSTTPDERSTVGRGLFRLVKGSVRTYTTSP